ncbi:MAG: hypothetical protein ACT4TC_04535 [Myxococcaceae bacterium]
MSILFLAGCATVASKPVPAAVAPVAAEASTEETFESVFGDAKADDLKENVLQTDEARLAFVQKLAEAQSQRTGETVDPQTLLAELRRRAETLAREELKGGYLPPSVIKRSNQQFQETLLVCTPGRQPATLELHWVITPEGRVSFVESSAADLATGPLAECLRGAFSLWQYPRFSGEPQHVRQLFKLATVKTDRLSNPI